MFKKLLAPLDGTPQAAAALPFARLLANTEHSEVALLQVLPAGTLPFNGQASEADAMETLQRIATELGGAGLPVQTLVRHGDPAEQILAVVEEGAFDAIVMSTHGRAGLARAFLGSVTQRVLAASNVPMALLRPGGVRVQALKTLLVPVDGSPGGALALGLAYGLARSSQARIVLIQAVPSVLPYLVEPYAGMEYFDPAWDEDARKAAEGYVQGLAARLQRGGVEAEGRAVIGDAVRIILATAEEVHADLIVMSTHALLGARRAFLGSVADAVVREAHRPVLLARIGARALDKHVHTERAQASSATEGVGTAKAEGAHARARGTSMADPVALGMGWE
jgi:nucleotide-binding universal stress UspA family protein